MELKIYQGRYTAFLYSFIVVLLFGYFFMFIALYRIMQTINILPISIIVVGGVVILSIGFEHVIRAIFGYWD